MAFLGIDNRVDLPKVSYSTALDYFVGMCFAFVLASIIQFSGVHFFTKQGSGEMFPDSDDEEEDGMEEQASNPLNDSLLHTVYIKSTGHYGSSLVTEWSNQHCSPKFIKNISSQCISSIELSAKIVYCFVSRV